jgi:molybdopterin-binding protein
MGTMSAAKLTRSQVAKLLGVTTKTLYTWEKEGRSLPPERDWRGWRWYDDDHVAALRSLMHSGRAVATVDEEPSAEHAPTLAATAVAAPLPGLEISARNRLAGVITHISCDGVLAEVVLDLGGGNEIVSVITRSSVERLGLHIGMSAYALIKATEVMLAREVQ